MTLTDAPLQALHRYGYPLRSLVTRDFRARYARSALGIGWAILQPLALLLLYTFVFSVILKVKLPLSTATSDFALYLMCGYLPFMAMSEGLYLASTSLTSNRSLLDKVLFPAEVLPTVSVVTATIGEIVGLVLLGLLATFLGRTPTWWLLWLPLLVTIRVLFTLGLSWIVSVLNVFLADIGQALGLLLTAWLFLTPIFYPASLVPERFDRFLAINPLHHLVGAYRAVILDATSPMPELQFLILWTAASISIGLWFFKNTIARAKDVL